MKTFWIIIFLFPLLLTAQEKKINSVSKLYKSGNYEKCIETSKKYYDKYKSPQFRYYQAFSEFNIYKSRGGESYFKRCLNSLTLAHKKDTDYSLTPDSTILKEIHDTLLLIGRRTYKKDKEASKYYFRKNAELFNDTTDEYIDLFIPKTPAMLQQLAFKNYSGKINQKDELGRRQGLWVEKYDDGVVKYEIEFKDGHPAGVFRKYFPNGNLKADMFFDQTGKRAAAILYDENGHRVAMGYYFDKKRDSLWQFFINDTIVISEINYNKGVKNGPERVYSLYNYPSVLMERFWKNGKLDSLYTICYPNGQPKFWANYKNGVRDGDYVAFNNQGRAVAQGQYVNGLREGEWKFWNDSTQQYVKVKYINGLPENYDQLTDEETKIIEGWEKEKGKYEEPSQEIQNQLDAANGGDY